MDVVYPYRRPWDEFELRFSLRSVAENMPHARVIIAGDPPKFKAEALTHVAVSRHSDRFMSSTRNIVGAIEGAGIEGEFVVMNDDFFILKPWTYRREHKGTVEEYAASGGSSGGYLKMVLTTRDILAAHGVEEPLFFGLHTPAVYDAQKLVDLVREFEGQTYLLKTLYCNLFPMPSVKRPDVKAHDWTGEPPADDMFSTSDQCARSLAFKAWMRQRFPTPSPYERGAR